jgi:hypothetical protein
MQFDENDLQLLGFVEVSRTELYDKVERQYGMSPTNIGLNSLTGFDNRGFVNLP